MQAVIIAAGESSRFWPLNKDHKSLFSLMGKPLLYWTVAGLIENGVKEIIVVCGKDSRIPSCLGNGSDLGATIFYAYQEKPLGTGNALWQAKDLIRGPFFVMWPNKVNSKEIIAEILLKVRQEGAETVLVGAETDTPWDYGIFRFQGASVQEIVENPEKGKEPSTIKAIGSYFFQEDFFSCYAGLSRHHEADFIDAINVCIKEKNASSALMKQDAPSLKYPWHTFEFMDILMRSDYFKPAIASSARVFPGAVIGQNVFIGENTVVKAGTIIEGPCFIGNDCEIGPYNILRGPLNIEAGVKTGAYCEIKRSIIQEGTHLHSGYIGDSIISRDCRFGAGFITANKRLDRKSIQAVVKEKKIDTGLTAFGAVIGENTHVGVHTDTMPGIFIGSNCKVLPGVHVFENLPDDLTLSAKTQTSLKRG